MDAGRGGAFRILTSAAEGIAIAIGAALDTTVTKFVKSITNIGTSITEFIDKNRQLVIGVAKVAAGVAIFGGALAAVGYASVATSVAIGGITSAMGVMGAR